MSATLSITRVVNACVLLRLGDDVVLTDPFFSERWFMRMREPIGLRPTALPRLAAILGGHGVFDHWQPSSLAEYRYKAETPVLVATDGMRRKAVAAAPPCTTPFNSEPSTVASSAMLSSHAG